MRIATLLCAAVLSAAGIAHAQKIESVKPYEAGDTMSHKWVMGGKTLSLEDEFAGVVDGEIRGTMRSGDRSFEMRMKEPGPLYLAGMCLTNGQQCHFEPGLMFIELPLEKGRKWSTTFTVKGETFSADVAQERAVEKVEKVKVAAGEFEAYRIAVTGKIKGHDAKGAPFAGKEEATEWYAFPNGKVVMVKYAYKNSFGEKATRELTRLGLK